MSFPFTPTTLSHDEASMHMGMVCLPIQKQQHVQEQRTWNGQMVQSLFKTTARMLRESDFQKALEHVAPKSRMRGYRDMVDFLFCELVVGYRERCFAFYKAEAPALRDLPGITPEQIAEWDIFLASALHVARDVMEQKRRFSWDQLRATTVVLLAAAG